MINNHSDSDKNKYKNKYENKKSGIQIRLLIHL